PDLFEQRAKDLGLAIPVREVNDPEEAAAQFSGALPVLSIPLPHPVAAGQSSENAAAATLEAIEAGVELVMSGEAAALVTNPINKAVLYKAGFSHPGHTEYLGDLAAARGASRPYPVMMLVCDEFRIVPATVHIPLAEVPSALTRERLTRVIETTAEGLRERFGIARPRIAVTGLNPHAGENGSIGSEEQDVIMPVLRSLSAAGIDVSGPHPADTIFHVPMRPTYDAVVAMYHDQALIPVKTIAFDRAVNLTLGLPFVRTSPDHGTAYDLAGTGKADASSLIAALMLANELGARQRAPA
ncbi:MAG: 4-hydroxythreonine-4-phosphate dehydrogenase PdxA, partial [Pirellulales bacterium]|nr:4-hydroxythreonine-4-phosphate dehydrogenase PdxA [Pirellulales bacterium]